MTRNVLLIAVFSATAALTPRAVLAQKPTEIKGEAILKHPIGALAIKVADLLTAGKVDEVVTLGAREFQADWKKESAADRKQLAENMKSRAPSPSVLSEAIRKSGVLTIEGDSAVIEATSAAGDVSLLFERENGQWGLMIPPFILPGGPRNSPATETKLEREAILQHPIGELALRYADMVQGGKVDEMMRLASTEAQAKWKALPAGERKEDLAFRRGITPPRAELTAGIRSGGILFIADDSRATLNVVRIEQKSTKPGVVNSTSTTLMIPFVKENSEWKIAQ